MVRTLEGHPEIFLCEQCGLGYASENTARACEEFCRANNACSIRITRAAVYRPR